MTTHRETGPVGQRRRLRSVSLHLPTQSVGPHDTLAPDTLDALDTLAADALPLVAPTPRLSIVPPVTTAPEPTPPAEAPATQAAPVLAAPVLADADWTAPHRGRLAAVALLLATLAGTAVLGWRFYLSGSSADLTAVVVALAVVVLRWGAAVTATPSAVTLRGTVLAVWSGRDQERFDLADPAQLVDLVGPPDSPDWALLLHRRDGTARVLRRRDVDAVALDAVVRHHRDRAAQRAADRERRFDL